MNIDINLIVRKCAQSNEQCPSAERLERYDVLFPLVSTIRSHLLSQRSKRKSSHCVKKSVSNGSAKQNLKIYSTADKILSSDKFQF